jgi:hypothetical protein
VTREWQDKKSEDALYEEQLRESQDQRTDVREDFYRRSLHWKHRSYPDETSLT